MPKRLIIGISVASVLIAAAVLVVLLVRSRALTDEPPVDGRSSGIEGAGLEGVEGSATGQIPGTPVTTTGLGGPCGNGICSEGESSWCKPDCGSKEERFLGSIHGTVSGTSITISWTTELPSTGDISYGKTSSYELGTLHASSASTAHEIELTGLVPGTPYYVRVRTTEEGGQTLDSGELIFEL